ncbi:MAG: AIR synthase related protein, partial [Ferruginibacter sp.]
EQAVTEVFENRDFPCCTIGEVTHDRLLAFRMHGQVEAVIPAESLVLGGGAPQYTREMRKPAYLDQHRAADLLAISDVDDLQAITNQLLRLPSIASKRWVFEQYDSMVGAGNTSTNAPSDAAVVLAKPTQKALALTTDCNSRYVDLDPYHGAMIAVAEAARNIVCSGGKPLGVTNCLNFGNPYDPEVYYQFSEAIRGMGDACRAFETPVTGGNVSFYNQSPDGPVFPTPTIGMVGLLERIDDKMTLDFKEAGDQIYLLGPVVNDMAGSSYLYSILGQLHSPAPYIDLSEEQRVQEVVLQLIQQRCIQSAHDVSDGGVMITLMESGFPRQKGFDLNPTFSVRRDAFWFGESQSRVIVSVSTDQETIFAQQLVQSGIPFLKLGVVTDESVRVEGVTWGNITEWQQIYESAIPQLMNNPLN